MVGGNQAQEDPSLGKGEQSGGTEALGVLKTREGGPQPGRTWPKDTPAYS